MGADHDDPIPPTECMIAAICVAQSGSMSAAALQLGVTHAAISRRVTALEEWAGVKIFRRLSRGVATTVEGQRILLRLQFSLNQIASLSQKSATATDLDPVRVAVTPSFARFFLMPRMAQLARELPQLRIELLANLAPADLQGGEVDLAFRYGRGNWSKVQVAKFLDDQFIPVVAPEIHVSKPASILQLPLLHAGDTNNWRVWCLAKQLAYKAKPADRILADYSLCLDGARHGLGVALWNRCLHPLNLAGENLVALDSEPVSGSLAYYLLTRTGKLAPPIAALVEQLSDLR